MKVAITGGTGFLGRYIVSNLTDAGHTCRCWVRPTSDRTGMDANGRIDWTEGDLETPDRFAAFCDGVDALVHSALYRPDGIGFRASASDHFEAFTRVNLLGSLGLMAAAQRARVPRFVFISTCAVHEVILQDRPLDETHPLWPQSHYGAHKAAIEKFIHSFGQGEGWPICALRPTGIYGLAHPPAGSRWFDIVRRVCRGEPFESDRGGKEVHAADVARAVLVLLTADGIAGQAYNCYDRYVAEQEVAAIAKEISGSSSRIAQLNKGPKNQIDTTKLRALGVEFGGRSLLEQTVGQLLEQ